MGKMTNFIYPVNKPIVTSGYGKRTIASLGIYDQIHHGVDLVTQGVVNATIYASGDGKVVENGKGDSYGNYIKIEHVFNGVKYHTIYAHLQSSNVKVGLSVKQGDKIGVMGKTGRATGVHLHFEIRKNGVKENPVNYLLAYTPETLKDYKPVALGKEYAGSSVVDYLKSKGKKYDFTSRRRLAMEKGFRHYSGTAEENTKLLKLLRGY